MRRIGLVGVGLLGTAVAARLLPHGFEVIGYDTRATQLEALRPQGLRAAGSVAETAADADAVFTILPTLESVEAVGMWPWRAGGDGIALDGHHSDEHYFPRVNAPPAHDCFRSSTGIP